MDDYGYLNARIRAMNGELFQEAVLLDLLAQAELTQMTDSLLSSPYGEDLSLALTEGDGLGAIERALRRNLQRTFRKTLRMCSGEPYRLTSILLSNWDVFNIKTVLRGKQRDLPQEEILSALIPIGELDEAKLSELTRQDHVKAVVDTLATWGSPFATPLTQAFPEYLEKRQLSILEKTLDEFYFKWALSQTAHEAENEQLVRTIIREQIDYLNVVSALKIVSGREKVKAVFIPGGFLSLSFLNSLCQCKSPGEVLDILGKTGLVPPWEKELLAWKEQPQTSDIQRLIEASFMQKWAGMIRKDPLSISIILGFLGRKFNEFVNLRIIARGKAHGVPVDTIRGELVFV